jgi:hypothetical protein
MEDDEIPRYPPFMKGLPATHPDKLIETQRELIGQVREAGLASPEIFEQFYRQSLVPLCLLCASPAGQPDPSSPRCRRTPASRCRSRPVVAPVRRSRAAARRAGAATSPRAPAAVASGRIPRRPLSRRRQAGHRPGGHQSRWRAALEPLRRRPLQLGRPSSGRSLLPALA